MGLNEDLNREGTGEQQIRGTDFVTRLALRTELHQTWRPNVSSKADL